MSLRYYMKDFHMSPWTSNVPLIHPFDIIFTMSASDGDCDAKCNTANFIIRCAYYVIAVKKEALCTSITMLQEMFVERGTISDSSFLTDLPAYIL